MEVEGSGCSQGAAGAKNDETRREHEVSRRAWGQRAERRTGGAHPFENRRFRHDRGAAFAESRSRHLASAVRISAAAKIRPHPQALFRSRNRDSTQSCWRDRPIRFAEPGGGTGVEPATVGLYVRCSTQLSYPWSTSQESNLLLPGHNTRRSTVELHARQSDRPVQHPDMKRQGRIMRAAINGRTVDVCAGAVTGGGVDTAKLPLNAMDNFMTLPN